MTPTTMRTAAPIQCPLLLLCLLIVTSKIRELLLPTTLNHRHGGTRMVTRSAAVIDPDMPLGDAGSQVANRPLSGPSRERR